MDTVTCDVLVVGGGLAAATAIKNLLETQHDLEVCMAAKGTFGLVGQRGSGASSCGASETGMPHLRDMPASSAEQDLWHNRILQAGLGLTDRNLAAVMVEEAPKIKALLHQWGIVFGAEGPHHLGYPFIHAIEQELRSSKARLCENTMITDILIDDGQCVGAIGVTGTEGIVLFKSPAIVIAT